MVKRITYQFSKLLNLLGIILDIREVIAIIAGGSMTTILTTVIAIIKEAPWYMVVLFILLSILFTALVLALILGRMGRDSRIQKVPSILKQINSCNKRIALKLSRNLKDKVTVEFAREFAQLTNISDYENKIHSQYGKLPLRTEKTLIKRVNKAIARDIPNYLQDLSALTEKYHTGIRDTANNDFEYTLLVNQLENLRPLPNVVINNLVDNYLDYSNGLNTQLMFQQSYMDNIDIMLSQPVSLANRRYMEIISRKMNELLVIIDNAVRDYLKQEIAIK